MDKSLIYVISDKGNEEVMADSSSFLHDAFSQLERDGSHIPFVHQIYAPFWEEGTPVIHLRPKKFLNGHQSYVLTAFLPRKTSYAKEKQLLSTLEQLEGTYDLSREEVVYIKDKNTFGYDYEYYPPLVVDKEVSLSSVCQMFFRDAHGLSTDEGKKMFSTFRSFDLEQMFWDESYYSYPINHNGCGVILIDREGEELLSPITKNTHIETMSYLLSEKIEKDVSLKYTFPQIVERYQMGVVMIRSQQAQMFIPKRITEKQKNTLADTYQQLVATAGDFGDVYCARIYSDMNVDRVSVGYNDVMELLNQTCQNNENREEGINKKRI